MSTNIYFVFSSTEHRKHIWTYWTSYAILNPLYTKSRQKTPKKKSSLQAKWSETQKSTFTKIYWNYENSPCLFCFYEKGCQSIGKSLKNNNKISAKNREKLRNYSLLLRVSVEFGKSSKKSYSLNFCFRYNSPLLNISLKHFCFV